MTKTDIQKELDNNIPKDVVSTREGGGGKSLLYLETWYVIDRLNQVLGQGNWGYSTQTLTKVFEGEVEQYSGKVFSTSYTALVNLWVTVGENSTNFIEVGYGDGTDKKSPGKAHELATKEAVSDALKRAAKNLGRSMGLALYDKTQEYVGEVSTNIGTNTERTVVSSTSSKTQRLDISNSGVTKDSTKSNGTESPAFQIQSKKPIKELITSAFKVLEAQKKITAAEFKDKYQKGAGLSTLSEPTLQFILNSLKTDFPGLGL